MIYHFAQKLKVINSFRYAIPPKAQTPKSLDPSVIDEMKNIQFVMIVFNEFIYFIFYTQY